MRLRVFVFVAFVASNARAEPAKEVIVRGRNAEPGSTTLTNAELRTIPGAFGDPFRAVEALPGATPMQSGTPYTVLRGAPPGNTAYLIDGIPVPLLFHMAIGPAVLPTELIDRVDYFAGGAPARFGRAVGGVVSAETRPPSERFRAYGQARFFDAGALVESPLAGGRGYAMAAGRYSYTAAALSLLSPSVSLDYWDYQTRAGARLNERDEVSVFAFGSHDLRGRIGEFDTTYFADFHRVDLRFDRRLSEGGRLRMATTLGEDVSSNEQGATSGRSARVRLEIDQPIDETARVRGGLDASFTRIDMGKSKKPEFDLASSVFYPEHSDTLASLFLDAVWRPVPRLEITPGARADLYSFDVADNLPADYRREDLLRWMDSAFAPMPGRTTTVVVDPRLASRFKVAQRVTVIATIGRYHQGPSFFAPSPGLQPAGFQRGLQGSFQRSVGVELSLPAQLRATTMAFSHEYRNATAFTKCAIPRGGFDLASPCIGTRSNGSSVGVEMLVTTPASKRVRGFVAYTLSRSVDEPVERSAYRTERRLPTVFDHTHVLNAATSVDLGRRWTAGARLFLYTGRPTSRTTSERTGTFARLDVRIEKRWPFFRDGWLAVVAEMLNATFAREDGLECPSALGCEVRPGPPVVIPSLGVEGSL